MDRMNPTVYLKFLQLNCCYKNIKFFFKWSSGTVKILISQHRFAENVSGKFVNFVSKIYADFTIMAWRLVTIRLRLNCNGLWYISTRAKDDHHVKNIDYRHKEIWQLNGSIVVDWWIKITEHIPVPVLVQRKEKLKSTVRYLVFINLGALKVKRSLKMSLGSVVCVWMRSTRLVRASGCQCQIATVLSLDPSILRHSVIWGAADEAVLKRKNPKKKLCVLCRIFDTLEYFVPYRTP